LDDGTVEVLSVGRRGAAGDADDDEGWAERDAGKSP
jgi:hypothetical protein